MKGKHIEVSRCQADGTLLTKKMISKGICAGHKANKPAIPTWVELFLIYIGVIE